MKQKDIAGIYEAPAVQVIEIAVETGFATTGSFEDIDKVIPPVGW